MQKLGLGVAGGGLVLLLAACLTFFVGVPIIINNKVKEETRLETDSDTFNKWKNVEVPVTLSLTFFNITNPNFIEDEESVILTEVGPYVWEENRQKVIVEQNDDDDTISYKESITYIFRRDLSVGSDDDTISTMNFPLIAISTILKKTLYGAANIFIKELMNKYHEEFVLTNVKIRELMFDGIEINELYKFILGISGREPDEFSGGRFAFYRTKNGTDDGVFKIKRGIDDHETFGKIISWDNQRELDWWTNDSLPIYEPQYCNKINGTDGSLFPPFVEKDRTMRIFVLDICRSIYLTYNKEIEFNGIKGYQFTVPSRMFAHPDINEDNRCFCTNPGGGLAKYCKGGVIRIFACKNDAPLIVSNPHFLDASPEIMDHIEGLKADREIHGTQIEVEPRSGMLLVARKRIQFNVEFQPLKGITLFSNIPEPGIAVPLFWAEEKAQLTEKDTDDLKGKLLKPLNIVNIVQWTVIGVLIVVVLVGGFLTFR